MVEEDIFSGLETAEPDRDIDVTELANVHRSVMEVESESPNLTDLQATLKYLIPKFADEEINKLAQAIMVARVFPDTYLDRMFLTVVSLVEGHKSKDNIDVMMIINLVDSIFSIGLDGKGRIDIIEVMGKTSASDELEGIKQGIG